MSREAMGRITRSEKAARIVEILNELYPETPKPLDNSDPYSQLLAVLHSVSPVYERGA